MEEEGSESESGKSSDQSVDASSKTLEVIDKSNTSKHKKSKHKKKSKRKSKRSKRKHKHRSRSGSRQGNSRSKSVESRERRSKEREKIGVIESAPTESKRRKTSTDGEKEKSEQSKSEEHRKRSLERSQSKQREREKTDFQSKNKRHRSRSRDNSESRKSRKRTPSRERSMPRKRSRSQSHDRWRYDSMRSRHRSPHGRRQWSPRRSDRRSRSRSYDRNRYGTHRRHSRSRSYERRSNYQRRSRSRSQRRSRDDDRRRHSRSKSGEHVAASVPINLTVALSSATTTTTTITSAKPTEPKSSIADFTALCKKLTEADENGDVTNEAVERDRMFHPFKVKPAKDIVISPVILPVIVPKPSFDPTKPLEQTFPVSRGSQHKSKEDSKSSVVEDVDGSVAAAEQVFQSTMQQEKLDVSGLITQRLAAQGRLMANPNDVEAKLILEEVQMKIQNWAAVNLKPGQFTGENLGQMMSKEGINSGYQAWVRKDMFHKLNPIQGGVGMRLLTKMGWKPGQVLGKRGEGQLEPIALDVKTDRKGLISSLETQKGGKGSRIKSTVNQAVQGKHPVSALAEHCTKMKWNAPVYNVVHESGPSHKKNFLYAVIVDGYSYQYNIASNNKKLAKAQAAFCALKNLGVLSADAKM